MQRSTYRGSTIPFMSEPHATPAGWYDDGSGHQRWWDGSAWGPYAPPPATGAQQMEPPIASAPVTYRWSGISITGFILGVAGLLSAITGTLLGAGFIVSAFGVIFSIAGLATDKRRGLNRGHGLATAGVVLSVPALLLSGFVLFIAQA